MSLSSLARAVARSARSSRPRQGFSVGGLRPPPSHPLPPAHGGDAGALGLVRGYLTASLGSPAAVKTSDWRNLLASPQFRRLFSGDSKKNYENYFPKGKKEAPKGEGSNKDSKQESNSDDQWNFQDGTFKQLQNFLGPLLILGFMFSSLSSSSSDQKEISFQEFKNKLLEPGLVDRIVVSNKSVAKVYRISLLACCSCWTILDIWHPGAASLLELLGNCNTRLAFLELLVLKCSSAHTNSGEAIHRANGGVDSLVLAQHSQEEQSVERPVWEAGLGGQLPHIRNRSPANGQGRLPP